MYVSSTGSFAIPYSIYGPIKADPDPQINFCGSSFVDWLIALCGHPIVQGKIDGQEQTLNN